MEAESVEKVREDLCAAAAPSVPEPRTLGAHMSVSRWPWVAEAPDWNPPPVCLSVSLSGMSTSSWAQGGHVVNSLPEERK